MRNRFVAHSAASRFDNFVFLADEAIFSAENVIHWLAKPALVKLIGFLEKFRKTDCGKSLACTRSWTKPREQFLAVW